MQSESKTDKPEFIHLDQLAGISDEVTLSTACNFSLHLTRTDIRFQCQTSIDYQDWMQALEIAYGLLHANTQDYAQVHAQVQNIRQNNVHPQSSISLREDNDDLMKRAYLIRQSIEHQPQNESFNKYKSVTSLETSVNNVPIPPRKDNSM